MVGLIVSNEQAAVIRGTRESVEIVDSEGNRIGFFTQPMRTEEIEAAKKRSREESQGSSLDEIWQRLHKVASS